MSAILPSSLSSKLILSCLLIAGVVAAFLAYSAGSGVPFVAGSSGTGVIVSKTSLSITEGRWGYYEVKLASQPAADATVTVSVTSGDESAVKISPAELTFSTHTCNAAPGWYPDPCAGKSSWNRDQYVDVVGKVGGSTVTLSHAVDGTTVPQTVSVTVKPKPSLALSADSTGNEPLTLTGSDGKPYPGIHVPLGGKATFYVALGTAPSSDVTLDLSRHYDRRDSIRFDTDPDTDGDQSSLTFAKSAWSTPQAVTVRSVGAPGGVRSGAVVRLRPSRSTGDSGYRYLSAVDVRVRESDGPALVLKPGRLDVAEGGTASYQLRLAKVPASSVTVSISLGSGDGDLTVKDTDDATGGDQLSAIVFTPENWSSGRWVTLAAADDDDVAGGERSVVHTAASDDAGYDGLRAGLVAVEVDDDVPGLVIPVSSIDVTENSKDTDKGNTASYTVSLDHRPSADVAVAVSVSGDDSLSVLPVSLAFTSSDWNVPQTVTVTAATDVDLLNGTATIRHTASGGGFDGVSGVVIATEIDDSGTVRPPNLDRWIPQPCYADAFSAECDIIEGTSTSYGMSLGDKPSGTVTIRMSLQPVGGGGDVDITVSPSVLTFDSGNWDTYQYVTVTAAEDSDLDNGKRKITHVVSGGGYNDSISTMTLRELDNDPTVTFHETENGAAVTELSVLEGQPKDYWIGVVGPRYLAPIPSNSFEVEISLVIGSDSDISFSHTNPTGRKLNSIRWLGSDASKKKVTVTAADDADSVDGVATLQHIPVGNHWEDFAWNHVPIPYLTVREIDDDVSGGGGGQGASGQGGGGGQGTAEGQDGGQSDPVQPPGPIGSVNATRVNDVIAVEWSAAQHATGYHVVYSTDGGSSWTRVSTNQSGLGYTLGKADAKLSYIVGVQAVNSAGVSAWVNSGTVPPAPVVLGTPSLSVVGNGSASWSYSVPDGADFVYYEIRWRATAGQSGPNDWSGKSNLVFYNRDKLSHTIDGLDSGTEYKAKVFVGLKVDGKWRYAKSNTVVFTAE